MSAEARLKQLGLELPPPVQLKLSFVRTKRVGNLLFVSGHGPPLDKNGNRPAGKVGRDLTLDEAYQVARLVGLNLLANMRAALSSLDRVKQIVKVFGMVNSAPGFNQVAQVINGCSDLLVEVFGEEAGLHARSSVGVAELPFDFPVEIEMVVEVE